MKFEQMLMQRESCRGYRNTPVSRDDLIKICEAGRMAPSGCNAQPWKFLLIDSAEAKEKFCQALVMDNGDTGAPWREECPAYIVLVEQEANVFPGVETHFGTKQRFAQGDVGMACLNMCYQALELGLSSCILGLINGEKMRTLFGVPAGQEVRMALAVGYPKEEKPPRPKMRKPLDEVLCINEWK